MSGYGESLPAHHGRIGLVEKGDNLFLKLPTVHSQAQIRRDILVDQEAVGYNRPF